MSSPEQQLGYTAPRRPTWKRHQWRQCSTHGAHATPCGFCASCREMQLDNAEKYIKTLKAECARLAQADTPQPPAGKP